LGAEPFQKELFSQLAEQCLAAQQRLITKGPAQKNRAAMDGKPTG